jgi:serine phosphatase RsbU (regulator of sigma subunit)
LGRDFQLEGGDLLFVFTDGLLESHGSKTKPLSWKAITKLLEKQTEPDLVARELAQQIDNNLGEASLQDDCAFLFI